jgi:hypothetical protein
MKLEFSQKIFEKYSNMNFLENMFSGSQGAACTRTDRHDKVNSCLCNFDSAPKNGKLLLAYLKKLHTTKKWSLLALIITLMVKWDIKRVLGHLYTKRFFLWEPVS